MEIIYFFWYVIFFIGWGLKANLVINLFISYLNPSDNDIGTIYTATIMSCIPYYHVRWWLAWKLLTLTSTFHTS